MYLLLCLFSSAMAVLALSSWAAKQGSGFAVDELTGQLTGIGDYRRAVVQAGAASSMSGPSMWCSHGASCCPRWSSAM